MKPESEFVRELRERGLYEAAKKICLSHAIRLDELIDVAHFGPLVDARRQFTRHLREHKWSYPMIARLLHRDHTTIYYLLHERKQVRPSRARKQ
jgi:hypothetical protein